MIKERIQRIQQNNPGWVIRVWTDDECVDLIREHFSEFYTKYKDDLNPRKLWDVARIAILYAHGGIYLDHDVDCDKGVSFQHWLAGVGQGKTATLLLVAPVYRKCPCVKISSATLQFTAGNYFMGSVPRHPFWLHYMKNIELGMGHDLWVLDHTGPRQLAPTIHSYINHDHEYIMSNKSIALWDNFQNSTQQQEGLKEKGIRLLLNHEMNPEIKIKSQCKHLKHVSPAELVEAKEGIAITSQAKQWLSRANQRQIKNRTGLVGQYWSQKNQWQMQNRTRWGQRRSNSTAHEAKVLRKIKPGEKQQYIDAKCNPCSRLIGGVFPPDPSRKLAFVHIHKTGGTTMENFLGLKGPSCHASASAIKQCKGTNQSHHLSFTIIRNPIERAKSMYHYTRHGGNGKQRDLKMYSWVKQLDDFASFVRKIPSQRELIFAPQSFRLMPANASSIMSNGDIEVEVTNILCLESIENDWKELVAEEPSLQQFGDFSMQEPVRVSKKEDDIIIDDHIKTQLEAFYEEDFILWNHYCSKKEGGRGMILDQEQRQLAPVSNNSSSMLNSLPIKDERIVWFLHFHKAGGTSFTDLAGLNGEVKRHDSDPVAHSHFDLDGGKLRWPLVVGKGGKEASTKPSTLCFTPQAQVKGLDWKAEIRQEFGNGVTFVSTEHWFPRLNSNETTPSNLKFVTVLRDPLDRLLSSYYFHSCATRCPGNMGNKKASCRLSDWAVAEANIYTRLLNGHPYAPMKMDPGCTESYAAVKLNQTHLDFALGALQQIDLVLMLDTIQSNPAVAKCAMKKILGWDDVNVPHSNRKRTSQCAGRNIPAKATKDDIDAVLQMNSLDVELYKQARGIETTILESLGCL